MQHIDQSNGEVIAWYIAHIISIRHTMYLVAATVNITECKSIYNM